MWSRVTTLTLGVPAGSLASAEALLARRRAQSAIARGAIHETHVARPEPQTQARSSHAHVRATQQPATQRGPGLTATGGISGADCLAAPASAMPTPLAAPRASQLPQYTQFPGHPNGCLAAVGTGHCATAPLPAQVQCRGPQQGASAPAYWECGAGPSQPVPAELPEAVDWGCGSQDLTATQLQFSPKREPPPGTSLSMQASPLQQVRQFAAPQTIRPCMHVGHLQPPGPWAPGSQPQAAAAQQSVAYAVAAAPWRPGGEGAPNMPPRLTEQVPVSPVSPPGSYGARMAERLRQATTLMRVHGPPVAAPGVAIGDVPQQGDIAAAGGGGCAAVPAQGGGSSRTPCTEGVATHVANRGPRPATGFRAAQLGVGQGAPQGLPQRATHEGPPPPKRARTKAQRLQQLHQSRGESPGHTVDAHLDPSHASGGGSQVRRHAQPGHIPDMGASGQHGAEALGGRHAVNRGVVAVLRGTSMQACGAREMALPGRTRGHATAMPDTEEDEIELVSVTPGVNAVHHTEILDVIDLCDD